MCYGYFISVILLQFLRGKRLVNLVNQNDSAATKIVTNVLGDVEILGTGMATGSKNCSTFAILEDKCAILGEKNWILHFQKGSMPRTTEAATN